MALTNTTTLFLHSQFGVWSFIRRLHGLAFGPGGVYLHTIVVADSLC